MSYILFIDSGIGGLTTLSESIKIMQTNFLYFADNKFSPYGDKSVSFIQNRLAHIINMLTKKYDISLIVLACNTATTTSISHLRTLFPNLIFVGTEPALKTAQNKHFIKPAIIATPQTIKHLNHQKSDNVHTLARTKFASTIERYMLYPSYQNKFNLIKEIYVIISKIKNDDCLVLGCTHYSIIKNYLQKHIKKEVIDGNQAIASQIKTKATNITSNTRIKIILSSKNRQELQNYKKILNQILANQIKL